MPDTTLRSLIHRLAAARVAILFCFHAAVFASCYALAWLLRFDFSLPPEYLPMFRTGVFGVVAIQLAVGVVFGFYSGWWRYVGLRDVARLFLGLTIALVMLSGLWYAARPGFISPQYFKVPRGVLLTDWAFSLLALFVARAAIRLGQDQLRTTEDVREVQRVLIIGAGDAGETLAREIEHRPQLGMKVVGFVDDQRAKWRSRIRGIAVHGPISNVARIADDLNAREALIAIPSASGKRLREIISHLAEADLRFKTIPGIDHIVSGKVHVTQLRPVNVEDLLRRTRIDLIGESVAELFRGKRVLVTGAGGTIGSELASQILQFGPARLALVERSEFALYEVRKRLSREAAWNAGAVSCNLVDVASPAVVDELIAREKPHIVLHAAAHKHVPLGEENPLEYLRNNALATRNLAEIASRHQVERFVLISTDKAINPTSVMGASKRAAEILLMDHAAQSRMKVTIVRFGNVIGSSGSVIPLFIEQIAAGGPVTVTHPDVTRYFIRTSEAISLVLQAAALGDQKHGCVFMLDMGEPMKIAELAGDLIRLSNHTTDEIPIVFTGLRPGEKMFEEIRLTGESIHATIHPHIVITEAPQPDQSSVALLIRQMQAATNSATALLALRTIVPEYLPSVVTPPPERPVKTDTPVMMTISREVSRVSH